MSQLKELLRRIKEIDPSDLNTDDIKRMKLEIIGQAMDEKLKAKLTTLRGGR